MNACQLCSTEFSLTEDDLKALKRWNAPPPKLCPNCRQQRRLSFRNERSLYQRNCDLCKKQMISIYAPDKPFTVYCSDCWWGDQWDSTKYGRDFDFNRPFFPQFQELMREVPLLGNMVFNSTNSEYNSFCTNSKDCYLSSRVADSENVLYSYLSASCLASSDGYNNFHCQYCYECVDCWNCYEAYFCQLCRDTSNSAFCFDCIGCRNCFGSVGLRNAEYFFFNKKCTKEEYEKNVAEFTLSSYKNIQTMREKFAFEKSKHPMRGQNILHSQNAVGDFIIDSKDVYEGYDIEKTDTARYSWGVEYARDIYDCSFIYYGENCFENISNSKSTNIAFSFTMINGVHDVMYSMFCFNNTQKCFGSISLKQKRYCILNKQYTKEEYEELVTRIIEHMRGRAYASAEMKRGSGSAGPNELELKNQEFGEFFPISMSPFAYNESIVQNFFPLTKQEANAKGFEWREKDAKNYQPQIFQIPDKIQDVTDAILSEILACAECQKNYRITPQELKIYRRATVAIPRKCPDCRHFDRMKLRNPKKLFNRRCQKCKKEMQTSYSPERPEMVYCEECYLKELY